ncbi:hypothetical protein DAI22_08g255000 [Oryza sativa Japonica Group]|nr:hypothetical protein DAI22_08g255000 [Oryza sativa Japonica Group]
MWWLWRGRRTCGSSKPTRCAPRPSPPAFSPAAATPSPRRSPASPTSSAGGSSSSWLLYGFAYAGPFGHFLHKLMDRFFKGKKGKETTAKKVLVEQLTASPWNNMMFMMYYGLVVEGRPFSQVKSKLKKDYASVQLTAWKFWPIVSWINYEYMPLQLRVLFHSFVASCWAVFLNLKAARSIATSKKA